MTFTPSTEDVRTAWFQLTQNVESFDCWLAEVKAQEAKVERERIVKHLMNKTSLIKFLLDGEVITLDAWDGNRKLAEQLFRKLIEGEEQ